MVLPTEFIKLVAKIKRKIPLLLVETVLENPQQTIQQDKEITLYQSQLHFSTDKLYLLRVFINTTNSACQGG